VCVGCVCEPTGASGLTCWESTGLNSALQLLSLCVHVQAAVHLEDIPIYIYFYIFIYIPVGHGPLVPVSTPPVLVPRGTSLSSPVK